MVWTGQSFSVGQILTAAQMTNLQNDITAAFAKDSGAPVLASDYILDVMIANGVILESSLAAAVTAQLVTNGDSHDHSGGDGAAIPNASVTGLKALALLDTVPNGSIDAIKLVDLTAGNYGTGAGSGGSTFATTYTALGKNTLAVRAGSIRIKLGVYSGAEGFAAYAKIYKNGVAVGVERSTTSTTKQYFNEDFTCVGTDVFKVYGYDTSGYGMYADMNVFIGNPLIPSTESI